MSRLHKISVVTILGLCFCTGGIGLLRSENSGARLLSSHPTDSLFSHGLWRFKYTLPNGYGTRDFVGLQIRRVRLDQKGLSPNGIPSLTVMDEILCTSGIGLGGAARSGFVGIQLSDSFFSDIDSGTDETVLINGGLQLDGTVSQLKATPGFFLGQIAGTAVNHASEWSEGQLPLMQLTSSTLEYEYAYHVLLEIRNGPIRRGAKHNNAINTKSPSSD